MKIVNYGGRNLRKWVNEKFLERLSEITYKNGLEESSYKCYYENGKLWKKGTYVNGLIKDSKQID